MFLALRHSTEGATLNRLFYVLTKWRLVTGFPHAGIVLGEQLMHTNLANGLHGVPFVNGGRWVLIEVPDTADAQALFDRHKGTRYDWFSLLAFLLPWRVRDSSRLYCFEWCWLAMTGQSPGFRVTPEALLALAAKQREEAGA